MLSSEDWDGEKAKVREQKSLVDFMPPKQDTDPQMTEVMADDIPFQKLTIQLDDLDENTMEVTDTLKASVEIPVAEASVTDMAKSDDSTKTHYETLLEQELRMQRTEDKYALFIGILSEEEESDTEIDTDDNTYTYLD